SDRGRVLVVQVQNGEQPALSAPQHLFNNVWVRAQKPCGFRKHRPTCVQGMAKAAPYFDAFLVTRISLREEANERSRVEENSPHLETARLEACGRARLGEPEGAPKPSKCFGFVLRSAGESLTQPTKPSRCAS